VTPLRLRDLKHLALAGLPALSVEGAKAAIRAALEERLEDEAFTRAWRVAANTAGWLGRDAARLLFGLAHSGPGEGRVVEIGAYVGRATIVLAHGLEARGSDEQVVSIDPHQALLYGDDDGGLPPADTLPLLLRNLEDAGVRKRVAVVRATSAEAAAQWDEPIRLLYVDGLHDTASVIQDVELWTPFLVEEGVVIFDDYPIVSVQRTLEECTRRGRLRGGPQIVGAAAAFGLTDRDAVRRYVFPRAL